MRADELRPDKYAVHKVELTGSRDMLKVSTEALPMGSYVVLRDSDVFAPAALYGYAHLIQTAVELDTAKGGEIFTDEERRHLVATANFMVDTAQRWQREAAKKVPD